MEGIVVTLIAVILLWFDVISPGVYIGIVFGVLVWMYLAVWLYSKFGFLKIYYHDLLGWHKPDNSIPRSDGCSFHSRCKYCGKNIMLDSQGNWFAFEEY